MAEAWDCRGQADATHDVVAVGTAGDRAENQHGGQSGERAHGGVGQQPPGPWIGLSRGGDLLIERIDPGRQPAEPLEIVVAPAGGVRGRANVVSWVSPWRVHNFERSANRWRRAIA